MGGRALEDGGDGEGLHLLPVALGTRALSFKADRRGLGGGRSVEGRRVYVSAVTRRRVSPVRLDLRVVVSGVELDVHGSVRSVRGCVRVRVRAFRLRIRRFSARLKGIQSL